MRAVYGAVVVAFTLALAMPAGVAHAYPCDNPNAPEMTPQMRKLCGLIGVSTEKDCNSLIPFTSCQPCSVVQGGSFPSVDTPSNGLVECDHSR
jgi:hypothetical protein